LKSSENIFFVPIAFKGPEERNFNSLSLGEIFAELEENFLGGIMKEYLVFENSEALSMSPEELRAKVAELE
jgi:hypothetical protein